MSTFSKRRILILGIMIFVLSPSLLFAFLNDDLYDAPGIDPHRETLSSIPEEHIDTFTGGLTINHVDFTLPGNGGLDLVIQRTFNSKNVCKGWTCVGATCACEKGENTWLGYGWTLHFGKLYQSTNSNIPHFIEMPDGSMHAAYTKLFPTSITKDYWLFDDNNNVLTLTNGTKIYYGQAGGSSKVPNHFLFNATKIQDVNGNEINIHYKASGSDIITYVTDSDGRQVNFTTQIINGSERLSSIQCSNCASGEGVSISYTHQAQTAMFDTILTKANLPVGNDWEYTYNGIELESVKTPYGGTISYSYGFPLVSMGGSATLEYRAVTQKSVSGRDIPIGTWNIEYSQGTYDEYTQISDPCGRTIKYYYYGYGSTYLSDGNMWKIGLPQKKEISVGGTIEESISYDWTNSSSISDANYVMPTGHQDYYIYVPFLTVHSITRNGKTYSTSYSNYDSYGNPKTISEAATGDKARTTSIPLYWYDESRNIVQNKPLSETVSGGFTGSFTTTYEYYSTIGKFGNLKKVTRYGVATEYDYYTDDLNGHGKGNLKWSRDANLKTTNYQWDNGRISQIQTPEYTINKVINDSGTIYSTTDGRIDTGNHTTLFDYDGNLRLQSIDPPVGNTTFFDYASDNSYKLQRKATYPSGGYIYNYYDGFGRPSGTMDDKGITTDIVYKTCGPKDSTTSNVGDTVYYDNFGRVEQIKHKDNSTIDYTFLGSKVTIRDEELKNTELTYNAFGNPDDKLLVSAKDALNNTTGYDYNILGSLKSVDQGGISRTFQYDSTKNFLNSETYPEKGTISYPTRDGVGNIKSKQDALGTTNYTYDGVNRLIAIIDGTDSVIMDYDGANNRTIMDNPSAQIDYEYYEDNLLKKKIEVILGKTYITEYGYDGNRNLTDIYYPSGRHVVYGYNGNNQVTSITGLDQSGQNINNITYYTSGISPETSRGLLKSFTFSNGKTTNLTYNNRNFMETIQAGSAILYLGYTYTDKRGNLTAINDYLNGANTQSFSYDELSRLRIFNGPWVSGTYNYYFSGNRSSKIIGSSTTNYSYTNNRLTSTTGGEPSSFGYNTNGDAITMNGYTLEYDRLHNLKSYKQGSSPIAEYTYDGDGMRVTKTVYITTNVNKTTVYHYDKDGRLLAESDNQGNSIADYVYLNGNLGAKIWHQLLADVNNGGAGDGSVNVSDVVKIKRIAAGYPTDPRVYCADVSGDGTVNVSDVVKTKRMAAGLDPLQCCNDYVVSASMSQPDISLPDELPETITTALVSIPTDIIGDAGQTVEIPINVDDATGVAGYQFTVSYDPSVLTCTRALKGSLTQGWDSPTANVSIAGQITFLSIDPNLTELSGGSGSLAMFRCTAADNPGASTSLRFTDAMLSNCSGNSLTVNTANGIFTINPAP